jgi:hypothetical protein
MNRVLATGKQVLRYLPLAIPVLGLLELALHFYFAHRAPTKKQWDEVRPLVASWYRPGELVVIAPYWAEPMARWSFGDDLMRTRDVARADATGYREALEVATLGSRSPELDGWSVVRTAKQGKFTVRELTNPAKPDVTYDFTDHIDPSSAEVGIVPSSGNNTIVCPFTATASVESGGLGGPPTFPANRFACPGQPTYVFVGVTIVEDEPWHPRRCVWSHPPPAGSEIVTTFKNVPLGDRIYGHSGMRWIIERDLATAPFVIRVTVNGEEIGRAEHSDGDSWKLFEMPLGGWAHKQADVAFHVSSKGGGSGACFAADTR